MKKFIAVIFMLMVLGSTGKAFALDNNCWSMECQQHRINEHFFGKEEADRMEREKLKREIEQRIDDLEMRLNVDRMNRNYNW